MPGGVALSTTLANRSMIQPSQMSSMSEAIFATGQVVLNWAIPVTNCPVQLQEQHRSKSHPAEYLHDLWWYQLGPLSCTSRVYKL